MNEKLREIQRFEYVRDIGFMNSDDGDLVYYSDVEKLINTPKHETVEELRLVTIAKLVNEFNKRLESSCCNEITCNECNLRECPVGIVKDVLNEHGKPEIEG